MDGERSTLRLLGIPQEREGHEISAAQEASKARAQIEAALPDSIVLDVMLPRMSGLEFCAQLRELPVTPAVPIRILSAKGPVA